MKLNISNLLTLARVIVIPLIVFCIYMNSPFYGWTAFMLFCTLLVSSRCGRPVFGQAVIDRSVVGVVKHLHVVVFQLHSLEACPVSPFSVSLGLLQVEASHQDKLTS